MPARLALTAGNHLLVAVDGLLLVCESSANGPSLPNIVYGLQLYIGCGLL